MYTAAAPDIPLIVGVVVKVTVCMLCRIELDHGEHVCVQCEPRAPRIPLECVCQGVEDGGEARLIDVGGWE